MTATVEARPVLRGSQAKRAFISQNERSRVWVQSTAQQMAHERGHAKPTRVDRTDALFYVVQQRLQEEGRVAQPQAPATEAPTGKSRVAETARIVRDRAKQVINDNHFGHHMISWTLAHILAAGSVAGYRKNVLSSYLTRIDHESVYGTPQPMGRIKKGTMHAMELVPIFGDLINLAGAARGRHNFVGRKLDRPGRWIELLGTIPVVNASMVHDARAKLEDIVFKRLEAKVTKGTTPTRRR